ncbi:MAG TPA: RNA-binding protein [Xanthobacteraceae bacterium]|jgi:hypothetical protein
MLVVGENGKNFAGRRRAAGTERLCAATGEVKPVDDMIRFVLGPGQTVVPDVKRRLPGRGIWISASRRALELAIQRKSFQRGLKHEVCVPDDLIDLTERLLQRAALDALAMCHKAGRAVTGFARVEAALARDRLAAVLHAVEASMDGIRRLDRALGPRVAGPYVLNGFTSAQLDLAFGRSNVIHAGLLASSETGAFLSRVARLDRFRAGAMAGSGAIAKYGLLASSTDGVVDYREARLEQTDEG